MLYTGTVEKMTARLESPVRYQWALGETPVDMSATLGQRIELRQREEGKA